MYRHAAGPSADNCHVKVVPPAETVRMFKQGDCVNTEPVVGIINCKGACDSMAFFDTGKRHAHSAHTSLS